MKVSISSLPFNDVIKESLPTIIESGADFLHLDIMDGSLTENKTFNFEKIVEINNYSTLFLDCHLMIDNPNKIINSYIDSGVNILTVHYEAFKNKKDLIKILKLIKSHNIIAGLAIYPSTEIEQILDLKLYFDLLLIMSVEIGKYGQKFIQNSINKIKKAKQLLSDKLIEVDGGINIENAENIKNAGADIIVVGGAYKNAIDKQNLVNKLKNVWVVSLLK